MTFYFQQIQLWFFQYSCTDVTCCCSVAQQCLAFCNPMDCSTPGFPVLHHLPELSQRFPTELVMPGNCPNHCVFPGGPGTKSSPLDCSTIPKLQLRESPMQGAGLIPWLENQISYSTSKICCCSKISHKAPRFCMLQVRNNQAKEINKYSF